MSISSTALLHQNVIDFEFDSSDEEDEGYEMPTVEDAWKESAGSVPPGSQGESFSEQGAQSYLLPDVDSYRPAGDDDGVSIDANSAVAMSQFGSQAVGASQLESQVAGPTTSAGPNTGRGQNLAARVLNKVKTKSEIQEKPEKTGSNKSRVSSMSAAERFRMAQLAVKASLSASKMIVSLDEMRALPVPASVGSVKGYIVVDVAKSSQYPTYKYFLQEETAQDRFLLAAKRDRIADIRQHRYTFSIDPTDVSRTSGGYYGKLVANFTGTKYTLLDRGPKAGPGVTLETERRVLGACVYEPTDLRNMHLLTTKIPSYKKIDGQWHYCYKWGGRVKVPSVKNFQLVLQADQDAVVLLFGKMGKNIYACDFTYPLSAHQAFAIALSSIDSKLCMAF
eukprot:gene18051-21499_t